MSNFEYIISSLPFLTYDYKYENGQGFYSVLEEIKENLGEEDTQTLDFLLEGFSAKSLGADFYAKALKSPLRFVREYFRFDLNLRNAKVRYLNRVLGRPEDMDVVSGKGEEEDQDLDIDGYRFTGGEFEESARVQNALESASLLDREKALGKNRFPGNLPLLRHHRCPCVCDQAAHRGPLAGPGRRKGP